jgi:hypothetical protein
MALLKVHHLTGRNPSEMGAEGPTTRPIDPDFLRLLFTTSVSRLARDLPAVGRGLHSWEG